jgi:hypothetical protein
VRFSWADGAAFTQTYVTHHGARAALARMGFAAVAAA